MEWRHVIGWKGYYEVSECGDIRSVTRTVMTKRGPMTFQGRVLRQGRIDGGYFHVALTRPGRRLEANTHVMVARAFIGPCPRGKEVCHKDGTRTNNHYLNLRYGTRKSNAEDRKVHGTNYGPPGRPGETNEQAKLTEAAVRDIRSSGSTLIQMARKYGVSIATTHKVRTRQAWKHVT